jgi:hypothetical protein
MRLHGASSNDSLNNPLNEIMYLYKDGLMHFLDDLHENLLSGKDCPFSLDLRCPEHPDIHLGPLELQIFVDSFHSRLGQL